MNAEISYVYAVGRAGTLREITNRETPGLDGYPLRTVSSDGLEALVSSAPAEAFSAQGMQAQMENLARLEEIARVHHAVVDSAYAATTVLPLRLATVYLSDSRVTEMLHERHAEFEKLLAWLEGHVELGVKVYTDPRTPSKTPPPNDEDVAAPAGPGRAYLQQRRAQRRHQHDAHQAAANLAVEAAERATDVARARVSHRPQQGELATSPGENIANDAYLVPAARAEEVRNTLSALADGVPGVRIEITGPWAPYSFATPPTAAQDTSHG